MKKINIFIVLFAATMSTGCKNFLEKEPIGVIVNENYYANDQDMISAVNAAYDPMAWETDIAGTYHSEVWVYGDIVSDDARKGGENRADQAYMDRLETFKATGDDPSLINVWNFNYTGIFRSNIVIENAPTSGASEIVKNRVIGEAKFLRAYYHFYLLRMFGWHEGIPLLTKVLQPDEFESATRRAPKSEVFAQIVQDLNDAAAALPEKGNTQLGRATRGAALGLLTRVYLFQSNWQQVLNTANSIINSNIYSLESDYGRIFDHTNKNGVESLFEIEFMTNTVTDPNGNNWGSGNEGTFTNVMFAGRGNSGWGFNNPTIDLYNAFADGDPRRSHTIIENGETIFGEVYAGRDSNNYPFTPYYPRKYVVPQTAFGINASDGPSNYIIVRYADVLLMAAEAAFFLGDETTAKTYLNQVRNRVGLSDITSSGENLKNDIWHERRVELALEGLRFFDLVRQGRAAEVMKATGDGRFEEGRDFVAGIHEVFPIPTIELSLSQGNLNPNQPQ